MSKTRILNIELEPDFSGARELAIVEFVIFTPNPNQVPYVAVYEYFHLDTPKCPGSFMLTRLTVTRKDTREGVKIDGRANLEVRTAVCEEIALSCEEF